MNKNLLIIIMVILLFSCKTTPKKQDSFKKVSKAKIPGINTMEKYGKRLDPEEILVKIGETMTSIPGGNIASSIYFNSLNESNNEPVFVIESIEYNSEGLAVDIKGHIETPRTFREFVTKGGLGVPVYEPAEPNEFGVIFGRPGNIAIRDGVVVKQNPLDDAYIYDITVGSETYDRIYTASVLYQSYETTRTPFLKNKIIEIQGLILNSSSKAVILEGIKAFKEENKKMTEEEVMINFLVANKSYLKEIEKSDKESKDRINRGREMLDAISSACSLQTTGIVLLFTQMAMDIAQLFVDPMSAPGMIIDYTMRNIPDNSDLNYSNLEDIRKYGDYQLKIYQKNLEKNNELWKKYLEITASISGSSKKQIK